MSNRASKAASKSAESSESSELVMFHCYIGEERNGRVTFTTDKDCLSPDIIRFDERVFASERDMLESANAFRNRGYVVSVNTLTIQQEF